MNNRTENRTFDFGNLGTIEVTPQGEMQASLQVDLPAGFVSNGTGDKTWVFGDWQVKYSRQQIEKDIRRLAKSVANLLYVENSIGENAGRKTVVRTERTIGALEQKLADARAKLAAAQQPSIEA